MIWIVRLAIAIVGLAVSGPVAAQELSALARLDAAQSFVRDQGPGIELQLALSQPVPWRVLTLSDPPRLVMDFREVVFDGPGAGLSTSTRVLDVRSGVFRPGWSRLVLELAGPFAVTAAAMDTTAGGTRIELRLEPVNIEAFVAGAGAPEAALWDLPKPALTGVAKTRQTGEGPLVVVLDPGHGGIDPGAEQGSLTEAGLMLVFARDLAEAMARSGGFTVVMTRTDDAFVPLETRVSIARAAGADVFLSLHADAIAEGVARGATVYTLAEDASDAASAALAERHDREDLLAGVDLGDQDDLIAGVLMDMARLETRPRTDRLAGALVDAIRDARLDMHKRPRLEAAFSVLKSPDIPSVLLELGFLSNSRDLENLKDADWRARMSGAIVVALQKWALADAAEASLLRQ